MVPSLTIAIGRRSVSKVSDARSPRPHEALRRIGRRFGPFVHRSPGRGAWTARPERIRQEHDRQILTALLEPTAGSVWLDDANALEDPTRYKAILGYVPEEPHLYSYLTGPEYLQLVGRLRRIPDPLLDAKIDRFMQLLGIYDDRYQTLSSYSKGMRQKILIAAAVLHNPRVVVLDEPFSGLDVSAARLLKGVRARPRRRGQDRGVQLARARSGRAGVLARGDSERRRDGRPRLGRQSSRHPAPSLDAVFAALTAEENVDERRRGLIEAMKA